jgi:hypothetical protein
MSELDFFNNPVAMHVYALGALALIVLQIEMVALAAKWMPQRLPASIVRRAL